MPDNLQYWQYWQYWQNDIANIGGQCWRATIRSCAAIGDTIGRRIYFAGIVPGLNCYYENHTTKGS